MAGRNPGETVAGRDQARVPQCYSV